MMIHMAFTTEGLFEVVIESWPKWDLNPQPLNSIQMLTELSGLSELYIYIDIHIYIYIHIYI